MPRSSVRDRLDQRREEMKSEERRNRWLLIAVIAGFALVIGVILLRKHGQAGPVDLNEASAAQLDTLPGIGPETARAIIRGRPYESLEDLDRVNGIGPATIEKLRGKAEIVP